VNQQRRIEGQPAAGFLGRKHKDVVFIRAKAGVLVEPAVPTNLGVYILPALLFCLAYSGPVRTPSLKLTIGIVR
jgi:hypothetical protein